MEHPDFHYSRKPAFISFLVIYLICFGISLLLIRHSPEISREIGKQIGRLGILYSHKLQTLPYGIIVCLPFLIYGIRSLLWNVMTSYDITSSQIRLLAGSLIRNEQVFPISNLHDISFKQSLIEAPFGIGSLILQKGSAKLTIKGVYNVRYVVDSIRARTFAPYR